MDIRVLGLLPVLILSGFFLLEKDSEISQLKLQLERESERIERLRDVLDEANGNTAEANGELGSCRERVETMERTLLLSK